MVNKTLFPVKEIPTEEKPSLFSGYEERNRFVSEGYKASLAERYSLSSGKSYDEVLGMIETLGPESVATMEQPTDTPSLVSAEEVANETLSLGFLKKLSPDQIEEMYKTRLEAAGITSDAGTGKDVVDNIYESLPENYQEATDKKAATLAFEVQQYLSENMPDKGFATSTLDFFGSVARAATYGMYEDFTDNDKIFANETWQKLMLAGTKAERKVILDEAYSYANSRGLYGENTFEISYLFNAIADGGIGVNNTALNGLNLVTTLTPAMLVKGGKAIRTLPAMVVARDPVDVYAVTKGMAGASDMLEHGLANASGGIEFARQAAPAATRIGVTSPLNTYGPTVVPTLFHEEKNGIIRYIRDMNIGNTIDPEALEAMAEKKVAELKIHGNNKYLNHKIDADDLGNQVITVQIGKETGKVFTTRSSAETTAKRFGGEVKETLLPNGKSEYIVEVQRFLSLENVSKATDEANLAHGVIRGLLGSAETSTDIDLLTLKKLGANKVSNTMYGPIKDYVKAVQGISKGEKTTLNTIISDMQSKDMAVAYSVDEFKTQWYRRTNSAPSQKAVTAYEQSMYLRDAQWLMDAQSNLNRLNERNVIAVNFKGYGELKVSPFTSGVTNERIVVYNLSTKGTETAGELAKAGKQVYALADELIIDGVPVKHVTGSNVASRKLSHFDALPYKAGGQKQTSAKVFIKQAQFADDITGTKVPMTPKLIYATGSEKSARSAMTEINNILGKIREATGNKILTRKDTAWVKNAVKASSTSLDNFIATNNKFNPSVENLEDFFKMMDETGMDFSDLAVSYADETLGGMDNSPNRMLNSNSTISDLYRYQHNNAPVRHKTMVPEGFNDSMIDPLLGNERDFTRSINAFTQSNYIKAATEGLIKAAQKGNVLRNLEDISKLSLREQVKQAQIDTGSVLGKKLEQQRKVILRGFNEKTALTKAWEDFVQGLSERVFDKWGKQWTVFDKLSGDPFVALRGWAFDMKLGLFAFDQIIVQASQIPNMIAISPKHGLKAFGDSPALLLALADGRPSVVGLLAERASKLSSLPKEQFMEMVDYMKRVEGRLNVGRSTIELAAEEAIAYNKLTKVRNIGRKPFQYGEQSTRAMATSIAYREFRERFPLVDTKTKQGMAQMDHFITKRSDSLTANMTGASAASWQQGFPSLGTQWLSYLARNMEQIFIGRDLTGVERMRLAGAQLAFWGASGTGLKWAVDGILEETQTNLDPDTYTLVKYGVFDWIIGLATDTRTAYAERLSVFDSLYESIEKFKEDKFVEVVAGPSISIGSDLVTDLMKTATSMVTGNATVSRNDMGKVLNHFSGIKKIHQAWYIMNTGQFLGKDGRVMADGLTPQAAFWYTLGAPLQEISSIYSAQDYLNSEKEYMYEAANRISELRRLLVKAYDKNDKGSIKEINSEISAVYMGLNPSQKKKVQGLSKQSGVVALEQMIVRLGKNGSLTRAEILRQQSTQGEQ